MGDSPDGLVRVADIARLLGVSQQRADQLTRDEGFPKPIARDGSRRIWRRADVDGWVREVDWWTRRRTPWRRPPSA